MKAPSCRCPHGQCPIKGHDFVYGDDRLADNPLPQERSEFEETPAEIAARELREALNRATFDDDALRVLRTYYTDEDLREIAE